MEGFVKEISNKGRPRGLEYAKQIMENVQCISYGQLKEKARRQEE